MGHLIPAGTGYEKMRAVKLVALAEPVEGTKEESVEDILQAAS